MGAYTVANFAAELNSKCYPCFPALAAYQALQVMAIHKSVIELWSK
jgi:hypothetical protein